jgi:release factor glutamine methyltransferase
MSQAAPQFSPDTVGAVLREGVRRLESANVPSAALGAELLLMHTLGCDRAWLYAHPEAPLSAERSAQFFALAAQRIAGVPTQYLTGKQEFWGLDFEVTPDVLIPRPETEHLIEVALARLGESRKNTPLFIADVGTGSGCIAIALAKEFPNAKILATDISTSALNVASRNAHRHQVADHITFLECNLLEGVSHGSQATNHDPQSFDVIISNPPYVARNDAASLAIEVRNQEPKIALFAGDDGLALYPPLIEQASKYLKPGGLIVLELGLGQFEQVGDLLDAKRGWTRVSATKDLAGIVRVISAVKN